MWAIRGRSLKVVPRLAPVSATEDNFKTSRSEKALVPDIEQCGNFAFITLFHLVVDNTARHGPYEADVLCYREYACCDALAATKARDELDIFEESNPVFS